MTAPTKKPARPRDTSQGEDQLRRVRRICSALTQTTEKLSHGEPTFFVRKKVYTMFANNHHNDGHVAVWIPAAPGLQEMLVKSTEEVLQTSLRWGTWLGRHRTRRSGRR